MAGLTRRRANTQREGEGSRALRSGTPTSFSRVAWGVSMLYMILAAYVSWKEGTFKSGSVTMGFVEHGGMWGDFYYFAHCEWTDCSLPSPAYDETLRGIIWLISLRCHRDPFRSRTMGRHGAGGRHEQISSFPGTAPASWYGDMSLSGFLHLAYMSVELTLVLGYAVMPMPVKRVLLISGLLTVHLIVGQVQPGWYSTGTIWTARTIVPTLATVLLTWLIALYKMRLMNSGSSIEKAV